MVSQALLNAFRSHRQHKLSSRDRTMRTASAALSFARQDVDSGRAHYPSSDPFKESAVGWQDRSDSPVPSKRAERIGYVPHPEMVGLRLVGEVESEGSRNVWNKGVSKGGWFTDPCGDVFKDGTGLCWGVVYQLPGRKGVSRYVAGYHFGGVEGGPTLDFGTVYEEPPVFGIWNQDPKDHDAARTAAYAADSMAKHAAEEEKEYRAADSAGLRFYELGEEIAASRKEVLALLAEVKPLRKGAEAGKLPLACKALLSDVRSTLREIAKARLERIEF